MPRVTRGASPHLPPTAYRARVYAGYAACLFAASRVRRMRRIPAVRTARCWFFLPLLLLLLDARAAAHLLHAAPRRATTFTCG